MALWVLGDDRLSRLILGVPRAEVMGVVGVLALAANVASVLILMRYKDGDANVRSVWLCSRNDAIGNVAVMIAALACGGPPPVAGPDRRRHHGRAVLLFLDAHPAAIGRGNAPRAERLGQPKHHSA